MKFCPDCGKELSSLDIECKSCKKKIKNPFTIQRFLWDNFRLFTMIGITGTMISLIPNMGTRILGASWITDTDSLLPLFLSIIIFFGAIFLAICFLMIFNLVIQGRDEENVRRTVTIWKKSFITWYEGDSQRFILLLCLVPMWIGLMLFFILLMPLIPNKYSWLFASIIGLTCIPIIIFSFLGWNVGKKITGIIPGMEKFPRMSMVLFIILVIGFIVIVPVVIPRFFDNPENFSGDMKIRADQQYFSPQISSAKGLRLDITNISGRQFLSSRHTWSADYGYFIRVIPSTSEVTILGNPVYNETARDIYWTYSTNDPEMIKKPVKIDLYLFSSPENKVISHSSIFLTWYNNDIAYVNTSFE